MTLPKTPGIYKITNTVNGRFYIGSAVNLARRWTEHQQKLRRGKHANSHLQRSWLAHGGVVFGIEILEHVAALSNLIGREQFWIDRLQASGPAGYNLSPTAHSVLGYRHSPETRKRISEAKAGLPMPPHVAAGLRAANLGRPLTEAHRAALAAAGKGRKATPEMIAKLSAANLGKKHTPESIEKMAAAKRGLKGTFTGRRHTDEAKKQVSLTKAGQRPVTAKLSYAVADQMRRLHGEGTASIDQLAVKHSVTTRCVRDVLKYFTWRVDIDLRSFDRMPVNFNQQETPQ
jgi:group I intron endonuclease